MSLVAQGRKVLDVQPYPLHDQYMLLVAFAELASFPCFPTHSWKLQLEIDIGKTGTSKQQQQQQRRGQQ